MTHRKEYKQKHDASCFTYYIPETAVLDNEKECSEENYWKKTGDVELPAFPTYHS